MSLRAKRGRIGYFRAEISFSTQRIRAKLVMHGVALDEQPYPRDHEHKAQSEGHSQDRMPEVHALIGRNADNQEHEDSKQRTTEDANIHFWKYLIGAVAELKWDARQPKPGRFRSQS
jgi:hypothetical protein